VVVTWHVGTSVPLNVLFKGGVVPNDGPAKEGSCTVQLKITDVCSQALCCVLMYKGSQPRCHADALYRRSPRGPTRVSPKADASLASGVSVNRASVPLPAAGAAGGSHERQRGVRFRVSFGFGRDFELIRFSHGFSAALPLRFWVTRGLRYLLEAPRGWDGAAQTSTDMC
jgi:hypothetical protein